MNVRIRPSLLLPLPLVLSLCTIGHAATFDDSLPTPESIVQLEQRAQTADPREQCFLYTELVHSMTELAGREMLDGDIDQASATLKKVNFYAHLIHMNVANNAKRLKNAELLMHHTIYKLGNFMRASSDEDKATLQATLKQLDQVQGEILNQVFAK